MGEAKNRGIAGGLGAGVGAGLIWGLAFLLPELLHDWTPVTLTAGRYLLYGALSAVLFLGGGAAIRGVARQHWRPALVYAITGNIGYYLLVVIAVHATGAPITTMVIGCVPVTVALLGNWVDRRDPWRRLVVPVVLVAFGLIVVNGVEIVGTAGASATSLGGKVVGILAAFAALLMWATYGVSNGRFLAKNPDVSSSQWSSVVGVATGAITLVALPLAWVTGQLGPVGQADPGLLGLVLASIVLGMLVSWGGTWLWNAASMRLPTSLAGMLVVVETISGVAYVYLARGQWPPALQLVGFAVIIAGVLIAVRRQRVDEPDAPVLAPERPPLSGQLS
jgi:drug/metabolite transporter (DMT)-like permease